MIQYPLIPAKAGIQELRIQISATGTLGPRLRGDERGEA
jgi:hypothetical protein